MDQQAPTQNALFAEALRGAISDRGLSLERLRYHLAQRGHDLSVATLSYWQSGRSRPERPSSLAALSALEPIQRVPRGSLLGLILTPTSGPASLTVVEDRIAHGLVSRRMPGDDPGYLPISRYERLDLDGEGRLTRHLVRLLLRSTIDGLAFLRVGPGPERGNAFGGSATVARGGTPSCAPCSTYEDSEQLGDGCVVPQAAMRPVPVLNCSAVPPLKASSGADAPDSSSPQEGTAWVALDDPLQAGEAGVIEYELVSDGPPLRPNLWCQDVRGRLRELHLQVCFTPPRVPLMAQTFSRIRGRERRDPIGLITPLLSCLVQDFGPGQFGVSWRW